MKKEQLFTAAAMCVLALAACAPAAETGEAEAAGDMDAAEDAAASTSTLQSEMLADLAQVRDKYVQLAEAMPESDYVWRPAEGVRSVSEVYMHVVAANFGIVMGTLQTAPPESADPAWYDFANAESISDKATIVEALGASFDYVAEVIEGTSDDRLREAVNLFGGDSTVRGTLMLVATHCHEHLGQSIAYARTNGVTPPWSAGG
ncbi:MAG: DinB family protein [Gemmatimonadetes bacterium]|nr:DinB family protein [Gemmatimonadota bacterium]